MAITLAFDVYGTLIDTHGVVEKLEELVGDRAVNDAVDNGNRHLGSATLTAFSSTGPTDDGRIKPDIVANCCVFSLRSSSRQGNKLILAI